MQSYNTLYQCTYPFIFELLREDAENEEEKNKEYTEEEKDIIQQISYKNDLLNIFFLSKYDEECEINKCIEKHFSMITDYSEDIMKFSKELSKRYHSNYPSLGFSLLFTYDYLHYTHTCICEFFLEGNISEKSLHELHKAIGNL
jgi:hypothetical protein